MKKNNNLSHKMFGMILFKKIKNQNLNFRLQYIKVHHNKILLCMIMTEKT